MKKIILTFTMLLVSIVVVFLFSDKVFYKTDNNINSKSYQIAYMYEDENGNYIPGDSVTWQDDNYELNSNMSNCTDQSKPTWNDDINAVQLSINKGEKCTLYFSIKPYNETCNDGSLACTLVNKINYSIGNNGEKLLYHDENLEGGANDKSYRYIGTDPNNYVCFGNGTSSEGPCDNTNLYRIIGFFPKVENGQIVYQAKLIKADYIKSSELGITSKGNAGKSTPLYKYNQSNIEGFNWSSNHINNWINSDLNKALNNKESGFLNFLGEDWEKKIDENTIWYIGGNDVLVLRDHNAPYSYDYELGKNKLKIGDELCVENSTSAVQCTKNTLEYKASIGLMYVSDYMYGVDSQYFSIIGNDGKVDSKDYRSISSVNWLAAGGQEWFITRGLYNNDKGIYAMRIDSIGCTGHGDVTNNHAVRPTFYLKSDVTITSGDGTRDKPFHIN